MGNYRGFEVRSTMVGTKRFTRIYHLMTDEVLYVGLRISADVARRMIDEKYEQHREFFDDVIADGPSPIETLLAERPTHTISRLQEAGDPRGTAPPFVVTCPTCDLIVEPLGREIVLFCPYCQNTLALDEGGN